MTASALSAGPRPAGRRVLEAMWPLVLVLLAAELLREVWTTTALDDAERPPVLALSALMIGAVAVSRRAPLASAVTGFAVLLAVDVVDSPLKIAPTLGFATVPLAYMLGRRTSGRERLVGTAVAAAALIIVAVRYATDGAAPGYPVGSAITQVALSLAPIWLGATMRDRAALHTALQAAAARAGDDRERQLARTVLDERARIAGELHDLIAHALSAVVVQASAARIHAPHGTPAAAEAFAAVEATGRDALAEIRTVLDVLRAPDDDAPGVASESTRPLEPQPSVERLPSLLARSSIDTAFEIRGEVRALPASVDLNAYRVVQEALASAEASGARSARLTVDYDDTDLTVTVVDDGRPGRPALATRERVRLYGGELVVQVPRGSDAFRVRARLPIKAAA